MKSVGDLFKRVGFGFFNIGGSELWKYSYTGGCGNSISRFVKVLDKNKHILKEIGWDVFTNVPRGIQ